MIAVEDSPGADPPGAGAGTGMPRQRQCRHRDLPGRWGFGAGIDERRRYRDVHRQAGRQEHYRFFSGRLRSASLERRMLENELRRAIGRGEFLLQYLAKFDLKARSITGAEALLRWHHPDLGIIAPAKFIPLAEETGLIVPIGGWVLKTVCAQHMAWPKASRRCAFPST
jgi:predicted signal transduction protein with EAL and GGDEF domain